MYSIYKKEITAFFGSLLGYMAMAVFLVLLGLLVWVFKDNQLEGQYASLDILFTNAPFVFMLLIPAITMRSFADEIRSGTLELLVTRPLTEMQIILGKFFASVTLAVIFLLPTLLYYYTITKLGHDIDSGAIWGSYLGLVFLSAAFIAIGIFTSSLTSNAIVAFILALFLCFIVYLGFDAVSDMGFLSGRLANLVAGIGINAHYRSISRGVVDLRDAIYFLTFIGIFLLFTKTSLESRKW